MSEIFVGVTDGGWYQSLRALPSLDEVNFWLPSSGPFRALNPGGLFLFKLHYPENRIVGGGLFAHHSVLPLSLAWDAFREKNGVGGLGEMITRLARYQPVLRSLDLAARQKYPIGCVLIEQPFFFDEHEWFIPPGWQPNIVRGRGYSLATAEGQELFRRIQERRLEPAETAMVAGPGPRFGEPLLIQPRLGQGSFRVMVTDAYRRRCAITGERVLPVLEAAHIVPYAEGGRHEISNGLLLRSDLHTLFDRGYMTVTPELQVDVSRRLKEDWENGHEYYAFEGAPVTPPIHEADRPDPAALLWHRTQRFAA
ncbi:MAG: HNH endonuclease [Candidatus Dormiibacterota bacterium]